MLRILDTILDVIARLRPIIEQIERRDGDLAKQLRRSLASVSLNTAERARSRGKLRFARYSTAAGSMDESLANLRTAVAFGYVDALDDELVESMKRVIGTLVKCAR